MSALVDTFITYKIIRILTTPWEETDAFKYGIIDDNGKSIRRSSSLSTSEEKDSYTILHRLVFNLKRILDKLPFGRTKLASYAAALFLIKEGKHVEGSEIEALTEDEIKEKELIYEISDKRNSVLSQGSYILIHDVSAGDKNVGNIGDEVINAKNQTSKEKIFGEYVFVVKDMKTGQELLVTKQDIEEK